MTINNVLDNQEEYDSYVMAVYADPDHKSTIQGDGSLSINAEGKILGGIWIRNKLLIKSGNITINSDRHGFLTIKNVHFMGYSLEIKKPNTPKWKNSKNDKRLKYTIRTTDENVLFEIAKCDVDSSIVPEAVKD